MAGARKKPVIQTKIAFGIVSHKNKEGYMSTRKILVVDDVIDKSLTNICNAALKMEGLQMLACVNAVKKAITDEPIDNNNKGKKS